MRRFFLCTLTLALIVTGYVGRPQQAAQAAPALNTFSEAPCKVDVPIELEVTCGYLTVPMSHVMKIDTPMRLHVAIIKNTSGISNAPGMVYFAGGPGGSGTTDLESWIGFPGLETHDFITFDQRGMGYSEPSLNCPEMESSEDVDAGNAIAACRNRLKAAGVELSAFNSVESAADADALRAALGYKQWVLYGVSYGTKLALTVLRDYPAGVSAAIIDAVYPLHRNATEEEGTLGVAAINTLLAGCSKDTRCGGAFPGLEEAFWPWMEELNTNPADGGEMGDINAGVVYDLLFDALYDTQVIPVLPLVIWNAINGDFEPLLTIGGQDDASRQGGDADELASIGDAEGASLSVDCSEEVAFDNLDKAIANIKKLPVAVQDHLIERATITFANCEVWGALDAHPLENEPVTSSVPTLVLSGTYDPITPPLWGEAAAATLSKSYRYDFVGMGHGVYGEDDCPNQIVSAFLANPNQAPDSSCIAGMDLPVFDLGE
jgi:pimeloyl-ACP methyl ester carboxylesterase